MTRWQYRLLTWTARNLPWTWRHLVSLDTRKAWALVTTALMVRTRHVSELFGGTVPAWVPCARCGKQPCRWVDREVS